MTNGVPTGGAFFVALLTRYRIGLGSVRLTDSLNKKRESRIEFCCRRLVELATTDKAIHFALGGQAPHHKSPICTDHMGVEVLAKQFDCDAATSQK